MIGRQKGSGAPNGLRQEFEELNFDLTDDKNQPLIDVDAHVRLASPQRNNGIEILRRGYNFTDGTDGFGHLDAGLFFIAFVRNPVTQFIPMQTELVTPGRAQRVHHPHRHRRCSPCHRVLRSATGDAYWGSTLFGCSPGV